MMTKKECQIDSRDVNNDVSNCECEYVENPFVRDYGCCEWCYFIGDN